MASTSILPAMLPGHAYGVGELDTVVRALARAVAAGRDEVFVDVQGETVTYGALDEASTRFANSLAALGVKKGDTVVSLLDTSLDVLTIWFAINKLGAIWVPINNAYRNEFLRHQVSDAGAKIAICDPVYLYRFVEIANQLDLSLILCRGRDQLPECATHIAYFDDYRGSDNTPVEVEVSPSDLACLIYTSGTTGPSKGCMISHNYLCVQGRQQNRCVPQNKEEFTFTPLPLFHSSAITMAMAALLAHTRVAIWPRFSLSSFWEDIEQSGATYATLMASIFALVAHAPDTEAMKRCYGQLSMVLGHPITPEIRKIWKERFGVQVASSWAYGQTEGSRVTMATPVETPPELSAGRVAEEFEMMILDGNDNPVPDGQVGQIVYRPRFPHVMFEGYWRRPDEMAKVLRNLWMHSGDLGRVENGFLYFADRGKDYLRCRGENVSSHELERAFISIPDIQEVAIHAVGVQTGEDEIKATIVLRDGAELTEIALCHWAIEQLPHFAVPRYIEFRSELPKNPTGRILKFKLREDGVTASTWDRDAAGIVVRRRK